ncbi:hypothetical protein SESBI_19167 [Sesbania bispinosa]|nr:hypothetical protein SESBI_19167 [Sesbania bispinosa]
MARSGTKGRAEAGWRTVLVRRLQRPGVGPAGAIVRRCGERRTDEATAAEGRTEAGEERCWWSLLVRGGRSKSERQS